MRTPAQLHMSAFVYEICNNLHARGKHVLAILCILAAMSKVTFLTCRRTLAAIYISTAIISSALVPLMTVTIDPLRPFPFLMMIV